MDSAVVTYMYMDDDHHYNATTQSHGFNAVIADEIFVEALYQGGGREIYSRRAHIGIIDHALNLLPE